MTTPTISEYLKYANLQMAAEAFIRDEKTERLDNTGTAYEDALVRGNDHSSRFVKTQAEQFSAEWEVLDQRANTKTGFSGTLFRNRKTREVVLSFRSTEFIDDAARDNKATNELEIKETGFAWGQIADMQQWYTELKRDDAKLGAGQTFSVTGYSLGGHLATAFNLLNAGAAQRVVTFNLDECPKLRGIPSALDPCVANFPSGQLVKGCCDMAGTMLAGNLSVF